MFDANTFLNAVYTEVNDTKIVPCPAGEFHAQIEKIDLKSGQIGKGERIGQDWASLNVQYKIEDPGVAALLQRDNVLVYQSVMLDLSPAGGLDMGSGKNIGLGRLREATGLNQPGQQFSPGMFVGHRVKVMVRHVPGYKDPATLVAEVSGVVKA